MTDPALGIVLLLASGIASASFTVPMKLASGWAWENTWLLWSVFTLLLLPPAVTIATVPHLFSVYEQTGRGVFVVMLGLGAAWGVAQTLFGLAVDAIGITLAFAKIGRA